VFSELERIGEEAVKGYFKVQESLSLQAQFVPPKLFIRQKFIKRKLISHYFPRRDARNNNRFVRGRNSY
jgi:hypothetical protein